MSERRLFLSFSGGETSAWMTKRCLDEWQSRYDRIVVGFANTGEENEEALVFADRCNRYFNLSVVWLEALVHHGERKASSHLVVNFETASRNGEPYEDGCKKYGIPNQAFPWCTRELKLNVMRSYLNSIGWEEGSYDRCVGIRADEAHRRAKGHVKARILYPFLDTWPTTKPMVNQFWVAQPFRLELAGYEGNCKWCWKKSHRKHMTVMMDNPEKFDFPERMEGLYGHVGPEFKKGVPEGYRRTFFRKNLSTKDLRAACAQAIADGTLERAENDALELPDGRVIHLDLEPNASNGCSESCEVDFMENPEAA